MWILAAVVLAAPLLWLGPYWTSDGPVHIAMAKVYVDGLAGPLQSSVYLANAALPPNIVAYPFAGLLMRALGAAWAETALQVLCLVAVPLSAAFALRQIRPGAAALAGLAAAFALSLAFFLGLYNYCLSVSAFLLCVGAAVRAGRDGGAWWVALSASVTLAYLCHAAGLIAVLGFLGAWFLPDMLLALRRRFRDALALAARLFAVVLPAAVLMVLHLARQDRHRIGYDIALPRRIDELLSLSILAPHGSLMPVVAPLVAVLLIIAFAVALVLRARTWRSQPEGRIDTARWALAFAAALGIALLMPDQMGNGGTHFLRTIAFVYLTAILFVGATLPRQALPWLGALGLLLVTAQSIEAASVQRRLDPAREDTRRALAAIPDGCSVAPVIARPYPFPGMHYEALAHAASRVETSGDRLALFSFLARLTNYPTSYRPDRDPTALLYGWPRGVMNGRVERLDVAGWEAATGVAVDFLLVQEPAAALPPALGQALEDFVPATPASGGEFSLWRRRTPRPGCA